MSIVDGVLGTGTGTDVIRVRKTYTFAGGAGTGAAGTVVFFTITGHVRVSRIVATCATDLTTTGAATLALGVTGQTSIFIAATVATTIDANLIWMSATATSGGLAEPAITLDTVITANIIGTVAAFDITGGSLNFLVEYVPITTNGSLV